MRRVLPVSLLFFVATAGVFVLQLIPLVGIFLMFMLAMFWSVLLINAGFIGIAIEAVTGRVYRAWILVPLVFYAGYFGIAAFDHYTFATLRSEYDGANAKVRVPFNPKAQVLMFADNGPNGWFTQNYALDVVYEADTRYPEGASSTRIVERAVCEAVRSDPSLNAAGVNTFGFHDGDQIGNRVLETRFCSVSMLETPERPLVRIKVKETSTIKGRLPVTTLTTTISMPDGKRFVLLGGIASPLSWIPIPVMGCGLNSGGPSWECTWGFWRDDFTPIVSGATKYKRDSYVLARALGLQPVAIYDRSGATFPPSVQARMRRLEMETIQRQLANVKAIAADPVLYDPDPNVRVLAKDAATLSRNASMIMTGVERAAKTAGRDRKLASEGGEILTGLLANLPGESFQQLKPRLLQLYDDADEDHWLWDAEALIRRLGDLGPDAIPYLIDDKATSINVNAAGIEGLCRMGATGRKAGLPALLAMWVSSRDRVDRDRREALYVAMRRMDFQPPRLTDDKRDHFSELQQIWADISPQSPLSVCATRQEAGVRRQLAALARRATRQR